MKPYLNSDVFPMAPNPTPALHGIFRSPADREFRRNRTRVPPSGRIRLPRLRSMLDIVLACREHPSANPHPTLATGTGGIFAGHPSGSLRAALLARPALAPHSVTSFPSQ